MTFMKRQNTVTNSVAKAIEGIHMVQPLLRVRKYTKENRKTAAMLRWWLLWHYFLTLPNSNSGCEMWKNFSLVQWHGKAFFTLRGFRSNTETM